MTIKGEITYEEAMEYYFGALDRLDAELQSIEAKAVEEMTIGERYQLSLKKRRVIADIRKMEAAQQKLMKYRKDQHATA